MIILITLKLNILARKFDIVYLIWYNNARYGGKNMTNSERVLEVYKKELIKNLERKSFLETKYKKKLFDFYGLNDEKLENEMLDELDKLYSEIKTTKSVIDKLNAFINELVVEIVNGFDESRLDMYRLIFETPYLLTMAKENYDMFDSKDSENTCLSAYEVLRNYENGYPSMSIDIALLLKNLGFDMHHEGTGLLIHSISEKISPLKSKEIYNDIKKKHKLPRGVLDNLLNETVRKADLSEVDITLFDDIFPKGMSTSYLSVRDDMAFYLINKNNILAKVNGGKLNG